MAHLAQAIPDNFLLNWQNTMNVLADIFDVPAGLIMRVLPEQIEVLVAADREGNPYEADEKAPLHSGLYCETVMATRQMLHVPNALHDPQWQNNPDVALNMIAYLGLPLLLPDQRVFGTICVLDNKTRHFHDKYIELLHEIKRGIEKDFQLLAQQEQLQENNAELTAANEQLNRTLEALTMMQADLLRSAKNAALGALVAGVSHELSTPIGNGLMVASTMQHQAGEFAGKSAQGITRGDMRQFVDVVCDGAAIMMRNLDRAAKLVASFKRVAVDQANMALCRFNLHDTVDTVVASAGLRDGHHRIVNAVDGAIEMHTYMGAVADVLCELLDNARRHAFEGRSAGTITVSARQLDASVQLRVCDDGIGIPAADRGRVFDPFFTTRLGQGGSGLGLHTAYNLVASALRGNIDVECGADGGTCFCVTLPCTLGDGGEQPSAAAMRSGRADAFS